MRAYANPAIVVTKKYFSCVMFAVLVHELLKPPGSFCSRISHNAPSGAEIRSESCEIEGDVVGAILRLLCRLWPFEYTALENLSVLLAGPHWMLRNRWPLLKMLPGDLRI